MKPSWSRTSHNGSLRLRSLTELRRAIVSDRRRISRLPDDEPTRSAARGLGVFLAGSLSTLWSARKAADSEGPIDLIEMFSGCGGMSAGFLAVNCIVPAFRAILAVDIDEVANRTYAANLGLEPLHEDVGCLAAGRRRLKTVLAGTRRRTGNPLVLIGCAPCQGFSSHRNSGGDEDVRNDLFVDFARIAATLSPDAVVVENVPELLSRRHWPIVERATRLLRRAGYFVHLSVQNMAEFGVPQERFRAVMLAMKKPFEPPNGFLQRKDFRTVRDAVGSLPPIRAGERHPNDPMHFTAAHWDSTLKVIRAVPKNGGNRPSGIGPDCLRRAAARQGRGAYDDVYGRLAWDRPAITMTAYARNPASGRFVHPDQDRGLSIREAACLQGFPRSYRFSGTLDEAFRQIGNAVPPPFAAYLALHMLGELLEQRPRTAKMEPGISESIGLSFSRLIPALKAGRKLADIARAS